MKPFSSPWFNSSPQSHYAESELTEAATCKEYLQVRQEGGSPVTRAASSHITFHASRFRATATFLLLQPFLQWFLETSRSPDAARDSSEQSCPAIAEPQLRAQCG